jgi:hypothetical protein
MRLLHPFLTGLCVPLLLYLITKLLDLPVLLDLVTHSVCSPDLLDHLSPHYPSWGTWFHPERQTGRLKPDPRLGWNLLYHLGGNGPWIQRSGHNASEIAPPKGCIVDQVHMVCVPRHPSSKTRAIYSPAILPITDDNPPGSAAEVYPVRVDVTP